MTNCERMAVSAGKRVLGQPKKEVMFTLGRPDRCDENNMRLMYNLGMPSYGVDSRYLVLSFEDKSEKCVAYEIQQR